MMPALMLVDDEPNILKALRRELQDWADTHAYEIICAESAIKALEILKTDAANVTIVISDLKMPEMKGSDFLHIVSDTYPHITSMLLTGYSETEEVIKAVKAGIFSYILKPWDSDYLEAEVQKAFEHGELRRQNEHYLKKMTEELKWAGEMQKALLRPALPLSETVEFRVSYRPLPGLYCGGIYYDVIPLNKDTFLLLLGDVSGHGVRAAFITGILKAVIYPEYVRNNLGKTLSPGDFLGWLNSRMNFELRQTSGIQIRFFAGVLQLKEQSFYYANAGLSHPFILRSEVVHELPVSGVPLGSSRSIMYTEQTLSLMPKDIITLYTDGILNFDNGNIQLQAREVFSGIPYEKDYHRSLMKKAFEMSGIRDFSDDVCILTAAVL